MPPGMATGAICLTTDAVLDCVERGRACHPWCGRRPHQRTCRGMAEADRDTHRRVEVW